LEDNKQLTRIKTRVVACLVYFLHDRIIAKYKLSFYSSYQLSPVHDNDDDDSPFAQCFHYIIVADD